MWISRDKGTLVMTAVNKDGTAEFGAFVRRKGENSWDSFKDKWDQVEDYYVENHPTLKGKFKPDPIILKNLSL